MSTSQHEQPQQDGVIEKKGMFLINLVAAGVATSGACIFSNPMEVVKTRMQLQGELERSGSATTTSGVRAPAPSVRYRSFVHGFYTICRTEGLAGIQRGLVPGMTYQWFMNAPRLGLFEPLQKLYGATDPTCYTFPIRNIAAAATSGTSNLLFLL